MFSRFKLKVSLTIISAIYNSTFERAMNPASVKFEHLDDSRTYKSLVFCPNAINDASVSSLQCDIHRCLSCGQLLAIEITPSSVMLFKKTRIFPYTLNKFLSIAKDVFLLYNFLN